MLERLDPTAYKGEDHMLTGDSFILPIRNGSEDALNLIATRSITRPVFLDLGGTRDSFCKWRFKVHDMKPEFLPLDTFTRWIISSIFIPGLRAKH